MSSRFVMDSIPAAIRDELLQLHRSQPNLSMLHLVDVLQDKGYEVSKSALHRWLSSQPHPSAPADDRIDIRLKCLEAASKASFISIEELKSFAEELEKWVLRSD